MGKKYDHIYLLYGLIGLWSIVADIVERAGFLDQRETLVQAETIRFFPMDIWNWDWERYDKFCQFCNYYTITWELWVITGQNGYETEEAKTDSLQRERERGWNQSAEQGSNKRAYCLCPFQRHSNNSVLGWAPLPYPPCCLSWLKESHLLQGDCGPAARYSAHTCEKPKANSPSSQKGCFFGKDDPEAAYPSSQRTLSQLVSGLKLYKEPISKDLLEGPEII